MGHPQTREVGGELNSWRVGDLTPATPYVFTLTAHNKMGASVPSQVNIWIYLEKSPVKICYRKKILKFDFIQQFLSEFFQANMLQMFERLASGYHGGPINGP